VVVEVTMKFFGEPTDAEREGMIRAAMELTKDSGSVSVEKCQGSPKALLAVFRMKNEAGYRAVDPVAECSENATHHTRTCRYHLSKKRPMTNE